MGQIAPSSTPSLQWKPKDLTLLKVYSDLEEETNFKNPLWLNICNCKNCHCNIIQLMKVIRIMWSFTLTPTVLGIDKIQKLIYPEPHL